MIASMSRTRAVILRADLLRQLGRRGRDRAGIGLEAEQARADLVVQLERGAAPLVVLRGDQPMVEPLVLGARGIQRLRERIEAVGDGGELRACGRGSRTR